MKSKKQKIEEAHARQAAYDKLSLEEKLAKLGPHGSMRQRAKLIEKMGKN